MNCSLLLLSISERDEIASGSDCQSIEDRCLTGAIVSDDDSIGTFSVDGLTHPHAFHVVYTQNTSARRYAEQFLGNIKK